MMRKDIKYLKGIGFDDGTEKIVTMVSEAEGVSYAHAVRILIRIANDTLYVHPNIIDEYKDGVYNE